jgi:hypothetical protein
MVTPTRTPRGAALTTAQELQTAHLVCHTLFRQRKSRLPSATSFRTQPARVLLIRGWRVLPHVDHIFDTVIEVRLTHHCLEEAAFTLINHEISRGPLLASENLALLHPLSIPHCADAPVALEDGDKARNNQPSLGTL